MCKHLTPNPVSGLFRSVIRMYFTTRTCTVRPWWRKKIPSPKQVDAMTGIWAFCVRMAALISHYNIIISYSRARRGPKSRTLTHTHTHIVCDVYVSMCVCSCACDGPTPTLCVSREMSRDQSGAPTHRRILFLTCAVADPKTRCRDRSAMRRRRQQRRRRALRRRWVKCRDK